jgi:5-oxopent-3-ene-1,2,5-tricarboxylate decarboxylase / 2-hydroxyhepta-2,4-diene-1,7-dioate isomerase
MTLLRTATHPWQPQGTVYGTLLNFQREWDLWAPRMHDDPHKAPPQQPVLYVKSANTFNPAGQDLVLQDGIQEVDIGASLGLVMGDDGQVVAGGLMLDWSVPHASYFRPPVKFRCRDGYLGLPAAVSPWSETWAKLQIHVLCNGVPVQQVQLSTMKRAIPQLVADVNAFMTLQAGDVLMVGTDVLETGLRPRACAGDRIELQATGLPSLVQRVSGGAA